MHYFKKTSSTLIATRWYIFRIRFLVFNILFANIFCRTEFNIMNPNCTAVAHLLEARGVKPIITPKHIFFENVLRYCEVSPKGTCCSYNMESKLAVLSRQLAEKNINDLLGKVSSILGTRAQKFNDFFGQLLLNSKKEFHTMFKRTYGIIYEENAYMFSELFEELEKYYARGKVDLSETMDSFFNILYQKMFTVLNAQYTFSDKYLECVSDDMKEFKPFGDVPDKLSVQIKRSFIATRTFAQAIVSASEITKKLMNMRLSADCTAALTKMYQCGICKGYVEKPCANYCINVMKGCLQNFSAIDNEWDNFVNSIEKISERLLGPFNIVMVVEPINIKISEAIMNFQETGQDISKQVFRDCGRPVLGRKKRVSSIDYLERKYNNKTEDTLDIDAVLIDEVVLSDRIKRSDHTTTNTPYDKAQYSNSQKHQLAPQSQNRTKKKKKININRDDDFLNREPILDKLVKDIRQKVKDTKKFWSNLPYQICNNNEIAVFPDVDNRCWNGSSIHGYRHSIIREHEVNPEFPSSYTISKTAPIISNQLYYLKTAVSHLKNAYNGLDVDWSDQEELEESGSGSGGGLDHNDEDTENGSGSISSTSNDNTSSSYVHTAQNKGNDSNENHFANVTNTNYTATKKKKYQPKENSSRNFNVISLRRAIFLYLFPIYMAWFVGIFSDLL